MAKPLEDEEQYEIQTALLLTQAVLLNDEAAIQERLIQRNRLHQLSQFAFQHAGPSSISYLIAVTDGNLETAVGSKALKLSPTVFLAFGHVAVPSQLALHSCGMRTPASHEMPAGSRECHWASLIADHLPLQGLFSYLGQGYQVVLTGHGYGGLVAHAVAARLLLQLRQEIQMAQQLGINLSILGQTQDKVSSYAFSAPLLANSQLSKQLQEQGLADQLHTIWKHRDACPYFLTLCNELAVTQQSATADNTPASPTPQQQHAINHLSASLHAALLKLERKRGDQLYVCRPADTQHTANPDVSVPGAGNISSPKPELAVRSSPNNPVKLLSAVPPTPDRGKLRTRSNDASGHAVVPGGLARTSNQDRASPTMLGPRAVAPLRQNIVSTAGRKATSADNLCPPSPPARVGAQTAVGDASNWKSDLKAMQGHVVKLRHHVPLGRYWVIHEVPGLPQSEFHMELLSSNTVASTAAGWFSEDNPALLACFEWSAEEMERDLMEAYAWVTFKPTVHLDGHLLSREQAIMANRKLILCNDA